MLITAYGIVTTILFLLLFWNWGTRNKADALTKIFFLFMAWCGLLCTLGSAGLLHK